MDPVVCNVIDTVRTLEFKWVCGGDGNGDGDGDGDGGGKE